MLESAERADVQRFGGRGALNVAGKMTPGCCGCEQFLLDVARRAASSAKVVAPVSERRFGASNAIVASVSSSRSALVVEIEANDEVRRRRDRRRSRSATSPVAVVRLRIDAGVLRPHVQIARGEDEARVARAQLGGERVRQLSAADDFAQAPELAVLEVAACVVRRFVALRARRAPGRQSGVRAVRFSA